MQVMRFAAHRIVLLWGWRRALAAFLAGAFGALAMPPFGVFPALAVSFVVAVWLIDGCTGARGRLWPALRSAFATGCAFGFGYFLAGLWWVGEAFLVDAGEFGWLMPVAVLGLPALLAFVPRTRLRGGASPVAERRLAALRLRRRPGGGRVAARARA